MANIVWESKNECWCSDCDTKDVTECYCEACNKCGVFSEEVESREDVVVEEYESNYWCRECYDKFIEETECCESCEQYSEDIVETSDGDIYCKSCYTDEICIVPTDSVLDRFSKVEK